MLSDRTLAILKSKGHVVLDEDVAQVNAIQDKKDSCLIVFTGVTIDKDQKAQFVCADRFLISDIDSEDAVAYKRWINNTGSNSVFSGKNELEMARALSASVLHQLGWMSEDYDKNKTTIVDMLDTIGSLIQYSLMQHTAVQTDVISVIDQSSGQPVTGGISKLVLIGSLVSYEGRDIGSMVVQMTIVVDSNVPISGASHLN